MVRDFLSIAYGQKIHLSTLESFHLMQIYTLSKFKAVFKIPNLFLLPVYFIFLA